MKNREEKRDVTIDHLKEVINNKQPGKVSVHEGSFLLLERIEDLLKEQNTLLRNALEIPSGTDVQAGKDPEKRKPWWKR